MNREEFVYAEEKDGFGISEKRKKIWFEELRLLEELVRVCKKWGLKYYASNGTLLGVIRHGGFIPWDDDVDIAMPRQDYDRLISLAREEFSEPFLLHVSDENCNYYRNYARLRNLNTTAIPLHDWEKPVNSGIFIDIFPIESCYEGKLKRNLKFFEYRLLNAMATTYVYYPHVSGNKIVRRVLLAFARTIVKIHDYNFLLEKLDKVARQNSDETSNYVYMSTHGGRIIVFPRFYYSGNRREKFEFLTLPIPEKTEDILKIHYGDYMELPPVSERGLHHNIFFDPDKPYSEYGTLSRNEAVKMIGNY